MARTPADPSERLARLKAARKKCKPRQTLNQEEMAAAMGISASRLRQEIKEDPKFPIKTRGSEGKSYEFVAFKTIDYLIKKCEKQLAEREERSRVMAEMAGLQFEPEDLGKYSISELMEVHRAQTATMKQKMQMGGYVPLAHHDRVVTRILTLFQNKLLGVPAKLDKAGRFSTKLRQQIDDEMRAILVECHDELGELEPDGSGPS